MDRYQIDFAGFGALPADRVLTNDVILPWENHPYKMRLWIISHEFGAIAAAWASNEQDALDAAAGANLMDCQLVETSDYDEMTEDEKENLIHLGNASEPFYQDYLDCKPFEFNLESDVRLLCLFAEARGACASILSEVI